jgi:Fe-S-cluster containining protein
MKRPVLDNESMPENLCMSCTGACCKGPLIMSLSKEDQAQMAAAGTEFITVAEPADHDRDDVPYPIGHEFDSEKGEITEVKYLEGNETEPLVAGMGRYVMLGTCGNLTNILGREQCGIYDRRPQTCREFQAGGPACLMMRAAGHGGFEVQLGA